jgi:hypothetical protein
MFADNVACNFCSKFEQTINLKSFVPVEAEISVTKVWTDGRTNGRTRWLQYLYEWGYNYNSNITSFFLFVNKLAIYRLGIISLAHAAVRVTDFPVVNVSVDELSYARIGQHAKIYIEFNPKSSDMTIAIPRSCTFKISWQLRFLLNLFYVFIDGGNRSIQKKYMFL